MVESNYISLRFREVFLDGKWVANTNYKELLKDIDWQQATTKIGPLNTIAALTFHVNYYIAGILNVLEGGNLEIRDKYSFDMSQIQSKDDWNNLVMAFFENVEKFVIHIEQFSNEKLESTFFDQKYGNYRKNIEALIEHAYYHLGQISLIKKMIIENFE